MAKIRFNDYLKKKNKQEEVLFESDEDILRRVQGRREADPFIVSPDYRIENYRQSRRLVGQIADYPGAEGLMEEFREGLEKAGQEKREHALRLARQHFQDACTEDEFRKAEKEFAALEAYKDAQELRKEAAAKAEECRKKTTRRRGLCLAVLLVLLAAAGVMAASGLFGYLIAKAEGMAGIYVSARNRFEKLGDFLDAQEQAEYYDQLYLEQRTMEEKSTLGEAAAGDTVDFGGFTWVVAERGDTQLTLVLKTIDSDGIFGPVPYHEGGQEATWAECSLRAYLNTEVLEEFAPAELEAMETQEHTPAPNPAYGTDGGAQTQDRIRIPDAEEACRFMEDGVLSAPGADVWLSTPGHDAGTACVLTKGGKLLEYGDRVTDELSILAVTVVDYTKLGQ